MGAIGGLLGLGGGQSGTGIDPSVAAGQVPGTSAIQNPTTVGQANDAYGNVQNSMQSQNALLAALQGQNSLGLQTQAAQGFQNLANGTGPNPAMAQLNQTTGQNVANTGALMAGQRGAGQNVGLMARQVGQQGANTQQQAVGQAATMAANQQIAGLQGLAGQANTMAGQQIGQTNANTGAQQSEQANLLNALGGQNNANISMASNINNANAGLANTQLQGQQAMLGGLMNGMGSVTSMMGGARGGMVPNYDDGGEVEVGSADIGSPSFTADAGAAPFSQGMSGKSDSGGGGGGGIMSMLPMLMMAAAEGGEVPHMADGGMAPMSMFGQFLTGVQTGAGPNIGSASFGSDAGAAALMKGATAVGKKAMSSSSPQTTPVGESTAAKEQWGKTDTVAAPAAEQVAPTSGATGLMEGGSMLAAQGGEVPIMVSKGERVLSPAQARAVASGNASPIKEGKKVPGKPKYPGNDYRNDVVPRKEQPGAIIIPNEILQGKDAERRAISFVQSVLAKHRK